MKRLHVLLFASLMFAFSVSSATDATTTKTVYDVSEIQNFTSTNTTDVVFVINEMDVSEIEMNLVAFSGDTETPFTKNVFSAMLLPSVTNPDYFEDSGGETSGKNIFNFKHKNINAGVTWIYRCPRDGLNYPVSIS